MEGTLYRENSDRLVFFPSYFRTLLLIPPFLSLERDLLDNRGDADTLVRWTSVAQLSSNECCVQVVTIYLESFPSARLWCSSVVLDGKMYLYGGHTTQGLSNLISNVKNDLCAYDFGNQSLLWLSLMTSAATKKWEQIEHQMSAKTEHKCVPYNGLLWIVVCSTFIFKSNMMSKGWLQWIRLHKWYLCLRPRYSSHLGSSINNAHISL
jgi:hypothetical protein